MPGKPKADPELEQAQGAVADLPEPEVSTDTPPTVADVGRRRAELSE